MSRRDSTPNELKELAEKLGLSSDPSNVDAVRSELKARISEIHPDTRADDLTERFQILSKALRRVGKGSTALQTINRNSSIAKAEAVAPEPRETIEARLNSIEVAKQTSYSRAFLFPKISLGTVAAALVWVFFFPRTFAEHPFIGGMLKSGRAVAVWSGAVFFLAIAWLIVWWLERSKERHVELMLSLTHQAAALDSMRHLRSEVFSATEFQGQLYPKLVWYPVWLRRLSKLVSKRGLSLHMRLTYDVPMAEKVAELALERFLQKGWIVRTERPEGETRADDWYKLV
jgi:hypothetical protein